jgi:GT2 family glycosyltransferase
VLAPSIDRPLVSVVIPAYGAEQFIETTIRSIVAQAYRPMEVVVVEDASPDRTAAIAEGLAVELNARDILVRVLRQPVNMGCAAALRRGFAESRGDYICWLSADDAFVDSGKTDSQVRALVSGVGLSFCRGAARGAMPDDVRHEVNHWLHRLPFADRLFDAWPSWRLLMLLFNNAINGSSVMVSRSAIEKFGTFDPTVGNIDQDGDLWMRYSALGMRFRCVETEGVFYRIHPGQTTNLTDGVDRGCAMTRLRILLVLEESGRLGRTLRRSWPVLLPVARGGAYRLWPVVSRRLVITGLASHCGPLARVALGWLRDRLDRDGLWNGAEDAELIAAARRAMDSTEFVRFRRALLGGGVSAAVGQRQSAGRGD